MEQWLLIDACADETGASRTLRLTERFLSLCRERRASFTLERADTAKMGLKPYDRKAVAAREALIDADAFFDPIFSAARQLAAADRILVAAPYWDLSFPAILKTYVENIVVRRLTFRCGDDGRFIGLCRSKKLLYVTTAGGPIGDRSFGYGYFCGIAAMLGLGEPLFLAAEGLDLIGASPSLILEQAQRQAETLLPDFIK